MAEKILTSEELKEIWNRMSDWYETNALQYTTKVFQSLLPFLNLQACTRICEVGCGPGNGVPLLLSAAPNAELFTSDLSDAFVAKVQAKTFPRTQVTIANNEELPYADATFDRYVANLSLMIVESPERMLAEAFRVLQPGGIAAFSVWSSKEKCTLFSMPERALKRMGITEPKKNVRSKYHLSDENKLKGLFRDAGFTDLLVFQEISPVPTLNEDYFFYYYTTRADLGTETLGILGDDGWLQYQEALKQEIHSAFFEEEVPIVFQTTNVVCRKPSA